MRSDACVFRIFCVYFFFTFFQNLDRRAVWQSSKKSSKLDVNDFGVPFISDEIRYTKCMHFGKKRVPKLSAQQIAEKVISLEIFNNVYFNPMMMMMTMSALPFLT